jgi:hypothetical protein
LSFRPSRSIHPCSMNFNCDLLNCVNFGRDSLRCVSFPSRLSSGRSISASGYHPWESPAKGIRPAVMNFSGIWLRRGSIIRLGMNLPDLNNWRSHRESGFALISHPHRSSEKSASRMHSATPII